MPLSGIFRIVTPSIKRMTMFKKTDPNPQLDIFTAPSMLLGSRASKKYSDPNAWHNQFYSLVTTKIDEEIFKPLFPEGKKSGRPNASIRILVAMSVLKEGFGCSDEDLCNDLRHSLIHNDSCRQTPGRILSVARRNPLRNMPSKKVEIVLIELVSFSSSNILNFMQIYGKRKYNTKKIKKN